MRLIRTGLWAVGLLLFPEALPAQTSQLPRVSDLRISVGVQLTGVATTGAKADINGDNALESVSNRLDFSIRRGRVSLSGRLLESIDFRVIFFFDNLGKDRFSGTRGNPSDEKVGIWDAFWTWHASPTWASVTVGYFRPQIGRENMTSGFQTNSSMDKLPTQVYLRAHTVGRSSGREMGVNVGGLRNRKKWGVNYNLGLFDTGHEKVTGQANGGDLWSPLVVARGALSLGDPEMTAYGIDYVTNYFNRRKGVTGAVSYAHQGANNAFMRNETVGLDLLANYKNWNLDGELDLMRRRTLARAEYQDKVWHLRSGYNIRARSAWVEPVAAYMKFTGAAQSPFQNGRDELLDLGVNWYVRETRVKLNVHRTWQRGRAVSSYTDGRTFERGNLIGVGVQFVY